MSFTTSLWKVESRALNPVPRSKLGAERLLEEWIAADPSLLGRDLLVFGRQTRTLSGPLDLLAVDGEGELVIIELKRDRTPREVVAQVLDYASWIRRLDYEQLDQISQAYLGKPLATAFRERFQVVIPETVGERHSMLIVASEMDDSSERIVEYLQDEHDVNINAVFFNTFDSGSQTFLARSWLADPVETTERIEAKRTRPWSGIWFVNNGVDGTCGRDWEACRRLGFISAGGGRRWSEPLRKLNPGDRLVAYQKGHGYVGYGTVTRSVIPASEFVTSTGKVLSDAIPTLDPNRDDPDKREYAVAVDWHTSVPEDQAKWFKDAFANQNVVCRLRDEQTVAFLRREFGIDASNTP